MPIEYFEPYKILIRSYFPDCIIYDYKDSDQRYGFVAITFDFTIMVDRFNCFGVASNLDFSGIRIPHEINTLNDTLKDLSNKYGNQSMTNTDIDAMMQQYINYVKTQLEGDYLPFMDVYGVNFIIINKAKFIRRNELKWKDMKEISKCLKIYSKK